MFSIEVTNLRWLEGVNEEEDICLHGDVNARIGDRIYERTATVSATALYLLKSITEYAPSSVHSAVMVSV